MQISSLNMSGAWNASAYPIGPIRWTDPDSAGALGDRREENARRGASPTGFQ